MNKNHQLVLDNINTQISRHAWFDLHLQRFDGKHLIIAGGPSLYNNELEVVLTDIFFASTFFHGWSCDTSRPVIEMPAAELNRALNIKFEIEMGYQIFIFRTEDYNNDIYIAAKGIAHNPDPTFFTK